mmetsp:Transcript_21507/g.46735  ORF Transcript_21507/g.46735 Transcript_21507/m.46735 type:complete len:1021 (-) Transcript_21507:158-3220(-)|eukprot:CAMPEP_0172301384 /NCGR_PEP_ID=MMETSP1058-20130122/3280_1 /TAXON_ID=83371 /ORGANISM="Detonula confervacea, Strain CCMP 353" /LENGTH=1020 /DNA_ID=CAMNT_0013011473 /DNA_START=146 /DNA_END=3208 /DNA_ORIENTATION=+
MASNQQPDHQLDATAAYVKQILAENQQQVHVAQPQATAQAQFLNQYLSGGGSVGAGPLCQVAPAASHQASMSRLLADYLKASQAPAAAAPAPTVLPPNLLAGLQAQVASLSQQPSLSLASNAAVQQQLLASAQLLSSVNPGLAAAAMAQALTMVNTSQPSLNDIGAHHNNPLAHAAPTAAAASLGLAGQQQPSVALHHGQQQPNGLAAHQMPQLRRPTSQPTNQQVSAGAAAAQFLLKQHPQGPQVGTPAIHSNRSSSVPVMSQHQQKRPSEIATSAICASVLTKAVPTPKHHAVSSGGSLSINTNSNSKTKAAKSTSSNNSSPSLSTPAQSSITSSSLTLPTTSSSGSGALLSNKGSLSTGSAGIHHHHGHHGNAAVASAALSVPHSTITTMQRWSLVQLDAHVKQLKAANQKIPQAVALLAADMRRKEEKRLAKRLANRKSACTSRARKKALIEEMTKDNARLRRQALILSFLPDPVVAISTDGVITFGSMQVERVLKHEVSDLIGANIEDIIVPSSRESIRRLIHDLIIAEQRALSSSVEEESGENRSDANGSDRENNSAAVLPHEVSEHSSEQSIPPLREVKVKAGQTSTELAAGEDVSDSSGRLSSLTHKNSESSEDQRPPSAKKVKIASEEKKSSTESDESISSQNKASANLTKNVEMCKLNKDNAEQVRFSHKDDVMGASVTANNADAMLSSLMYHPKTEGVDAESSAKKPEEQVAPIQRKHALGAKMANGKQEEQSASSAGSSLSKRKKRNGDSSEDSGYRESNESPEEGSNEYAEDSSSSSSSDRSSSKKKRRRTRPLAPACNVRLIRNDLSTIWCELTSSIRTRPKNDVYSELTSGPSSELKGGKNGSNNNDGNESAVSSEPEQEEKELLLCFRPIREGGVVGEELRFCSKVSESEKMSGSDDPASSEDLKTSSNNSTSSKDSAAKKEAKKAAASTSAEATSSAEMQVAAAPSQSKPARKNRPPKKRKFESELDNHQSSGKNSHSDNTHSEEPDEKSAVESMMELAKNPL